MIIGEFAPARNLLTTYEPLLTKVARIHQAFAESLTPKVDLSGLEAALPKFDLSGLEAAVPKIDLSGIEAAMTQIDFSGAYASIDLSWMDRVMPAFSLRGLEGRLDLSTPNPRFEFSAVASPREDPAEHAARPSWTALSPIEQFAVLATAWMIVVVTFESLKAAASDVPLNYIERLIEHGQWLADNIAAGALLVVLDRWQRN